MSSNDAKNIYVIFDIKNDIKHYDDFKTMMHHYAKATYNFYDSFVSNNEADNISDSELKYKIEKNLLSADLVIVLLAKTMKRASKFIKWQLECAIAEKKPIIAVNPNMLRSIDYDVCPLLLKKNMALYLPYDEDVIGLAVDTWPEKHALLLRDEKNKRKLYKYTERTYKEIANKKE